MSQLRCTKFYDKAKKMRAATLYLQTLKSWVRGQAHTTASRNYCNSLNITYNLPFPYRLFGGSLSRIPFHLIPIYFSKWSSTITSSLYNSPTEIGSQPWPQHCSYSFPVFLQHSAKSTLILNPHPTFWVLTFRTDTFHLGDPVDGLPPWPASSWRTQPTTTVAFRAGLCNLFSQVIRVTEGQNPALLGICIPSWLLLRFWISSFLTFLDLTLLYDLDANSFFPLQHCFCSVEDTAGQHFLLALPTSVNHLSHLSPRPGTPTWCQACRVCPGPLAGVMDRRFLKACCKSPGISDSCHVRTLAINVCVQLGMH